MEQEKYITFCPENKEPFKIPLPLFKKWVGELTTERVTEVGLSLDELKKVKEIMSKDTLPEELDKIPYSFLLLAAFDIITTTPIKNVYKECYDRGFSDFQHFLTLYPYISFVVIQRKTLLYLSGVVL